MAVVVLLQGWVPVVRSQPLLKALQWVQEVHWQLDQASGSGWLW